MGFLLFDFTADELGECVGLFEVVLPGELVEGLFEAVLLDGRLVD